MWTNHLPSKGQNGLSKLLLEHFVLITGGLCMFIFKPDDLNAISVIVINLDLKINKSNENTYTVTVNFQIDKWMCKQHTDSA